MIRGRRLIEFWYLAPPLGFLVVFLLLPLALLLGVSFTEAYPLEVVPSWASYRDLFTDTLYRSYLFTTILFGFVVTAYRSDPDITTPMATAKP